MRGEMQTGPANAGVMQAGDFRRGGVGADQRNTAVTARAFLQRGHQGGVVGAVRGRLDEHRPMEPEQVVQLLQVCERRFGGV